MTIQEQRIKSTLDKVFRYSEGTYSRREFCEMQKKSGAHVEKGEKPRAQWNRTKFNRMDWAEQQEYEKKMAEKVECYRLIYPNSTTFVEITKIEFDYFNTL